jgi:hypothetical protein
MPVFAKFSGLHTSHNYVGSVPEGALAVADNCLINELDTVEPRRGQYSLGYTAAGAINEIFAFGDERLVQYGTSVARDTGTAFAAYSGTFTPVDDALCRMRGVESAQNLYVNTATGVRALSSAAGEFVSAGVPPCLDLFEVGGSSSGFLADDRAVAYRAVIGQQDAHGVWRYGAPSQRVIVRNEPIEDVGLERVGSTVTAQLEAGTEAWLRKISVGAVVVLVTSEADFPSGNKTVTAIGSDSFEYTEAGAETGNAIPHTFRIDARTVSVDITLPDDLAPPDIVQVYRSETSPIASVDPGDEVYQVAEVAVPAALTIPAGDIAATSGSAFRVVSYVAHPFYKHQTIKLSGSGGADFPAGTFIVTATTADTFTYRSSAAAASTGASGAEVAISARSLRIEDSTPESLLGDPLYTNPNTGDGLEASRYEPLVAVDMCEFGGRLWQFNLADRQRVRLQMIGAPAAASWLKISAGGTDYTYTASSGSDVDIGIPSQRVFTTPWPGIGTPAQRIELSALSLVRAINRDVAPFYAVYLSAENDVPGKILIAERGFGGSAFAVTTSAPAYWSPALPSSGTTVTSENARTPAGVAWSEDGDPEAFPLGNRMRIGAKNDPILRAIGMREALFVFKRRGGLFVVPDQEPYYYRELDPTCRLLAPDTAVALNNRIFALTRQGLVSITEAGVDVIGWPLDYDVRALLNTAQATITRIPFSVAYESERQLWLWLPADGSSTCATQAYVYNYATQAFGRVPKNRRCGLVMPGTDILWLGSGDANTLARERKSFDYTDYADESSATVALTSVSGTALTVTSSAGVEVGDVLVSGDDEALVTAVPDAFTITIQQPGGFSAPATLTVYKGYPVEVRQVPHALGEPGAGKQISRAVLSFRDAQFELGKVTVSTDDVPEQAEYQFDQPSYGDGGYGVVEYGSPADPINKYASLGTYGSFLRLGFKIREARAKWKLLAMSADVALQGENRGR